MRDMKDTGIVWCPTIPDNWHIDRVKNYFCISKEPAKEKNPTVLRLARSGIQVRDISTNEGQLAESYENYNPVQPGDLLLNPMDLYSGANCNVSDICGVISPAYVNLRSKTELNPKFFDYYFKVQYWTMAMFAHGKGVSYDNRWTINAESVRNYEIPIPPIEEQNSIVNGIEENTQKIDALIANEEAQIEKLKEYKQSLITEVVTKGLDKDVSLKDSFVDSIGQIPVHWDIKKAKYIANAIFKGNGITKEDVVEDGDIQCVRYGELYSKYDISLLKTISHTNIDIIASPQHIHKGDILFACTGELVEEIGKNVVYLGEDPCLAGGDIIVMKHSQNAEFLNYAMYAKCSQIQKSRGKAKLKVVHISSSEIGNIIVALPPIKEQDTIANYLNNRCTEINALISIKQNKISDLKNYKKSLIYEYVTGKKEVNYDTDSN